jgi:ABC-type transporter MlaC component
MRRFRPFALLAIERPPKPVRLLRGRPSDYMMRRKGESWLISDIYLDGAISEVATRRSEFSTILRNEGIDSLIAALNRKADILTGTTAKAL